MTPPPLGAPYAPTPSACARCGACDCPQLLVDVDQARDGRPYTEHFALKCAITGDCVGLFFSTPTPKGPVCNECTIRLAGHQHAGAAR